MRVSRSGVSLFLTTALLVQPMSLATVHAQAQSPEASSPRTGLASECFEYSSELLNGPLRVCGGTPWPASTETGLMPLMTANREKFEGKTVLDIGTGTGILALYAAKLGAKKVVATDIEPSALACTQENARRFGLSQVVETRLVTPQDPLAYSVIRPGEVFDVIVAAPVHVANRVPFFAYGVVDQGITPNDFIRLGLSIVAGLGEHLSKDGTAILIYRSAVIHQLVVEYARHQGFAVQSHPPQMLLDADFRALYNTFAARVALAEQIEPRALLLVPPDADSDAPDGRASYVKVEYLDVAGGGSLPPLWDGPFNQFMPGLIVIRRAAQPGHSPRLPGQPIPLPGDGPK